MEPTITPNPSEQPKTKLILIIAGVFVVLCIAGLVFAFMSHAKNATTGKTGATTSPEASPGAEGTVNASESKLPDDVLPVIGAYISARENSVGADQATPTSWINTVRPILTDKLVAELQPPTDSTAGSASAEFNTAHDNGFLVKAVPSGCIWDVERGAPTAAGGFIFCNLADTTVNKAGNTVPDASIPFGWSHNGAQIPVLIEAVKQNGKWLINTDASGEFE